MHVTDKMIVILKYFKIGLQNLEQSSKHDELKSEYALSLIDDLRLNSATLERGLDRKNYTSLTSLISKACFSYAKLIDTKSASIKKSLSEEIQSASEFVGGILE